MTDLPANSTIKYLGKALGCSDLVSPEKTHVSEQEMIDSSEIVFRMLCNSTEHYEVSIVENLFDKDNPFLSNLLYDRRVLLVTTPTVHGLYGKAFSCLIQQYGLDVRMLLLESSEQNKSLDLVNRVCAAALDHKLGRKDILVALGGGICSDVVTVAASLIRRGISHIRIPTTMVGQIDAGIGIKGAVNFNGKKSYLGCFYPPLAVLIDPGFLRTLPLHHIRNGIAEIIKMAIIRDAELFKLVYDHYEVLISTAFQQPKPHCKRVLKLATIRMLEELKPNIYEDQTYKRLVDMGHTFSPLIEAASNFMISHGEAVAVDMALSASISVQLGLIPEADYEKIINLISSVGLPIFFDSITCDLCLMALQEGANHRGGTVNLVLPTTIGEATFLDLIDDLPRYAMEAAIERLARQYNNSVSSHKA
jgi:3-dehydroquinate synthetase